MSKIKSNIRFRIEKNYCGYIIIDKLKILTCLPDKKYTARIFESVEMAQGYIFGKRKEY